MLIHLCLILLIPSILCSAAKTGPEKSKSKKVNDDAAGQYLGMTTKLSKKTNVTRVKKNTTTTIRTRRTTSEQYVTLSWNEEHGEIEEGVVVFANKNPKNIYIREFSHIIEKNNQTIYEEKYLKHVLYHEREPERLQFHYYIGEDAADKWHLFYELSGKNYTIGTNVYFNLRKDDSKFPLIITLDNPNEHVIIRKDGRELKTVLKQV